MIIDLIKHTINLQFCLSLRLVSLPFRETSLNCRHLALVIICGCLIEVHIYGKIAMHRELLCSLRTFWFPHPGGCFELVGFSCDLWSMPCLGNLESFHLPREVLDGQRRI